MTEEIQMLARDVAPSTSRSGQHCPFCNGGREKEKSFSVTRTAGGGLLYKCHRNSCGKYGRIDDYGDRVEYKKASLPRVMFNEETQALTATQLQFFLTTYGLTYAEMKQTQFAYIPDYKAVWQPVFDPRGNIRGGVVRDYRQKKVRNYQEFDGAWISWHRPTLPEGEKSNVLVMVEDQLSAAKVARFYDCVALLGTYLGPDKVAEIAAEIGPGGVSTGSPEPKVILLLDEDAKNSAMSYWERYSGIFGNFSVKSLSKKDPKYWDDDLLKRIEE